MEEIHQIEMVKTRLCTHKKAHFPLVISTFQKSFLQYQNGSKLEAFHSMEGLLRAVTNGHEALVQDILEQQVQWKWDGICQGTTVLIQAVIHGRFQIVDMLLNYGFRVNFQDQKGWTALHYAVRVSDGHPIVWKLLQKGASLQGGTFLHVAARYGKCETLLRLLQYAANINMRGPNTGCTALHWAVMSHEKEAVELLLANGAEVWIQNHNGETALHLAVKNPDTGIMLNILERKKMEGTKNIPIQGVDVGNKQKKTALHLAAALAKTDFLNLLIGRGANLNLQDNKGNTALHLASMSPQNHKNEAVVLLLNHGASPWIQNRQGETALHVAVKSDDTNILINILKERKPRVPSSCIDLKNKRGQTATMIVALSGRRDFFNVLTNHSASLTIQNNKGQTTLHLAVIAFALDIVEYILKRDWSILNISDYNELTALHLACLWQNVPFKKINVLGAILRAILEIVTCQGDLQFRAEILNKLNRDGNAALHIALKEKNLYVAQLLIEAKASVHVTDFDGNTPLHLAVASGIYEAVQFLLSAGAECNNLQNNKGETALELALISKEILITNLLMVNSKMDDLGSTPLHYAAARGRVRLVRALLNCHAGMVDINAKDSHGHTALHLAALHNHTNVSELLLSKKSEVVADPKDCWDQTPLHIAASNGNTAIVLQLLSSGANIQERDNDNRTPFLRACINQELHLAQLLEDVGACILEKAFLDEQGFVVVLNNGESPESSWTEIKGGIMCELCAARILEDHYSYHKFLHSCSLDM